ncbi:MAG: transposase, partial [bacterium]|nr:transposase [bacterium]
MEPPANRLIDLLHLQYPDVVLTQPLPAHVRRAVRMAMHCQSSALGGHVERCPDGHIERMLYSSCGHRFYPRCAGRKRRSWLITQRAKWLPVRHDHVVFTLPHAVNPLWRRNPQVMGDLLFHSATDALRELLGDERRLGAEPGITVTLETWDDRLKFHPHLPCLVTGGGLSPEGEWNDVSNPRCLVAVKPLMVEFRKRCCQGLTQALTDGTLSLPEDTTTRRWLNTLNKANRQKWEVFIATPPEDGGPRPDDMLRYQAEDVAGGPLS